MVIPDHCPAKELYQQLRVALAVVSDCPEFEARQMLAECCGISHADLLLDRKLMLTGEQRDTLQSWVTRRQGHEPLQYLFGQWEFYGRAFSVGKGVLIPRPDTETLVEQALCFLRERSAPRVLDLCSGSGCIGLTLALERPDALVFCVEKSPDAFSYLTRNRDSLGAQAQLLLTDALLPDTVDGMFDFIVSNPPYLSAADLSALQSEVACEPKMALDGGEDGLYFYRELTRLWQQRLLPGGMLAYEIGFGQESAVAAELRRRGFSQITVNQDAAGIPRVVAGRLTEKLKLTES